ncbi:hypothetical protein vbSpy7_20 [Streptococcus phage vb_Spy_7]|nr:hypothetical protein vbSpy7_20 [Streptococcus phage vb_Spy_7]
MSGTFEKLMKNRDYWRDEAKAGWSKIEALEAENHELRWAKDEAVEAELEKLRKEIHRLQAKADERLASYAERTYQLIEAQKELEKWQLLLINHTMGGAWESVADFIKDQRPAVFSLPSDRWKIKLEDADDVRMADVERVEYMGLKLMKDPLEVPDLTSAKARIRKLAERKTKEARDRVAKEVSQLNLDLAAWAKRQEEDQEAQNLAKYNQRFIDPESLKGGLSVELEGTASQEVFDLIMGKPPEQELREITMVAKIVDDQPAHEAARPPRRTRRRVRRYRRWPR